MGFEEGFAVTHPHRKSGATATPYAACTGQGPAGILEHKPLDGLRDGFAHRILQDDVKDLCVL